MNVTAKHQPRLEVIHLLKLMEWLMTARNSASAASNLGLEKGHYRRMKYFKQWSKNK